MIVSRVLRYIVFCMTKEFVGERFLIFMFLTINLNRFIAEYLMVYGLKLIYKENNYLK